MKSLFFSLLICFLLSHAYASDEDVTLLEIGVEKTIEKKEVKFLIENFDYDSKDYLMITTRPSSIINPAQFYISQTEKDPSPSNCRYSSSKIGVNTVYIKTEDLTKQSEINISAICLKDPCNYTILAQLITGHKTLKVGEDLFLSNPQETEYIEIRETLSIKLGKTMVYLYGDPADDLSTINMTYSTDGTNFTSAENSLYGRAFNVDLTTTSDEGYIIIKIEGLGPSKEITVGARYLDQINSLIPYEYTYIYFEGNQGSNICYDFSNVEPDKSLYLNFHYLSKPFNLIHKDGEVETNKRITHNTYEIIEFSEHSDSTEKSVCFQMKGFTENDSVFLNIVFEAIYVEDIDIYKSFISPVELNTIYTRKIPKDTIMNYHYLKKQIGNDEILIYSHLTALRGKPVFYAYDCENEYPCTLTKDEFIEKKNQEQLIVYDVLNEDYSYNSNETDLVYIVSCESDNDCEYSFDFSILGSESSSSGMAEHYITLIPEYEYNINSFVREFICKVDQPSQYEKIQFTVSSLKDSCYIDFAGDGVYPNTTKDVRGKIIYELYNVTDEYKMEVKGGEEGPSCSVSYEHDFSNNVLLRSGIENIQQISKEETKHYTITRREKNDTPFVITVQSQGCSLDINFNGEDANNVEYKQYVINDEEQLKDLEDFQVDIKLNSLYYESQDNYCGFIISGGDSTNGIVATEGKASQFTLNSELTQVTYILPRITMPPYIYIEFPLSDKGGLNVNIDIMGILIQNKLLKSSYINLDDSYKHYCESEQCTIKVNIERSDNAGVEPIDVKFSYRFMQSFQPIYLPKNTVYTGKGFQENFNYFYTTVDYQEVGEVVIDFKKGGGLFYAKLVPKYDIERETNWNDRIYLPYTKDNSQFTSKDSMQTRFKYNKEDTEKCGNGCELYITIEDDEDINRDNNFNPLSVEYSIQINIKDQEIEMHLDEYAYGYLDTGVIKYYNITIPVATPKVLFTLHTEYANVYIGEGEDKPDPEKEETYKWKVDKSNPRVEITPPINASTLKGITFTIAVTSTTVFEEFSYYKMIFTPQYEDTPLLIRLTSENQEFCETTDEVKYCYFIIEDYEYEKVAVAYAFVEENPTFGLDLIGQSVEKEKLDKIDYTTLKDYLPTDESYSWSGTNILGIDLSNYNYVIVRVSSEIPQKINILVSSHSYLKRGVAQSNFYKLHIIESGKNLNFGYLHDSEKYKSTLDLYTYSPIQIDNITVITNGGVINYNEPISSGTNGFNLYNDGPDTFAFLRLNQKKENLVKLYEGETVTQFLGQPYPMAVYFPIARNVRESGIRFEWQETEELSMNAYLVEKEFIARYRENSSIEIEGTELNITLENYTYSVLYQDLKMEHFGYAIMVIFNQIKENYEIVSTNFIAYHKTYPDLPVNIYNEITLNGDDKITYQLAQEVEGNKVFKIEIGLEPTLEDIKLDYAVETYKNVPTYSHDKAICEEEVKSQGKLYLICQAQTDLQSLLITLFKNTTEQDFKILLKYSTRNDLLFPTYTTKSFNAKRTNKTVVVDYYEVVEDQETVESSTYYFLLYEGKKFNDRINEIDTIFIDNDLVLDIENVTGLNNGTDSKHSTIIDQDFEEGELYMNIVVDLILKEKGEHIRLSYQYIKVYQESFDELKGDMFYEMTVPAGEVLSYRLVKENINNYYFKVEVAYEASEPIAEPKVYLEKYKDIPEYKTDFEEIVCDGDLIQGKYVYIVKDDNDNEDNIIFSILNKNSSKDVKFIMKYSTAEDNNLFPQFEFNEEMIGRLNEEGTAVVCEFNEVFQDSSVAEPGIYHVYVYKQSQFTNITAINTIYLNPDLPINTTEVPGKNEGGFLFAEVFLGERPTEQLYVNVVYDFKRKDKDTQERVSYRIEEVSTKKHFPLEVRKFHNIKVTGDSKTYRLTKEHSKDELFQIIFAPEPHATGLEFKIAVESYKENPTGENEHDIFQKEEIAYGRRVIYAHQTNENEEDILITIKSNNPNAEVKCLLKYDTDDDNQGFYHPDFEDNIQATIDGDIIDIVYKDVFKGFSPSSSGKYIFKLYESSPDFDINTIRTIAADNKYAFNLGEETAVKDRAIKHFTTRIQKQPATDSYVVGILDMTLVYEGNKEKAAFISTPLKNLVEINSKTFDEKTANKASTNYYKLIKIEDSHKFFQIELATEPQTGSVSDLVFEFESFVGKKLEHIEDKYQYGKRTIVVKDEENEENKGYIILCVRNDNQETDIKFVVKYLSANDQNEFKNFDFDETVSATLVNDELTVEFNEIIKDGSIEPGYEYHILVYKGSDFAEPKSIHSVYYETALPIKKDTYRAKNKGEKVTKTIHLSSIPEGKLYVNVVYPFLRSNNIEERLSLMYTGVAKKFIPIEPRELTQIKVTTDFTTYVLEKEREDDKYYQIIFSAEPHDKNINFEIVVEKYKETPQHIDDLTNTTDYAEYGRRTIITSETEKEAKEILISIRAVLLDESDETIEVKGEIKYDTEEDDSQFFSPQVNNNEIKAWIDEEGKVIKVIFQEIYNETSIITASQYKCLLYQEKDYYDINSIETIYDLSTEIIEHSIFQGENNGQPQYVDINLETPVTGNLYVVVVAILDLEKEGNQEKVAFKKTEVNKKEYEPITVNQFKEITVTGDYQTFRLIKEKPIDDTFQIVFAPEPHEEGITFDLFVEKYKKEPTLKDDLTGTRKELSYGRNVITTMEPDVLEDDILISIRANKNTSILADIKYDTADKENELYHPTFNREISAELKDKTVTVKFTEVIDDFASASGSKYLCLVYKKDDTYNISTIDTIYLNSSHIIRKEELDGENQGATRQFEFTFDEVPTDELYVEVVADIDFAIGNKERAAFTSTIISTKKYTPIPARMFTEINVKGEWQTFRLEKEKPDDSFFQIVFATEPYADGITFETVVEKYKEEPSYKDDLTETNVTIFHGKTVITVNEPEKEAESIIISIKSTSEAVIKAEIEYDSEDNNKFLDPSYIGNLDGNLVDKTVTVQFKEIFDNFSNVDECKYHILVYEEKESYNISTIDTIYLNSPHIINKNKNVVDGKNDGDFTTITFDLDNVPENNLYLQVVAVAKGILKEEKPFKTAFDNILLKRHAVPPQKNLTELYLEKEKKYTYRLPKEALNNQVFLFEVAYEPSEENYEFNVIFEHYKNIPKYEDEYNYNIKTQHGKELYTIKDVTESDILVSLFATGNENNVKVLFKYQTAKDESSLPSVEFNDKLAASKENDTIKVSFLGYDLSTISNGSYHLYLYDASSVDQNKIHNIIPSAAAFHTEEMPIIQQNSLKRVFNYSTQSTDPEEILANVIVEFTKIDGTFDKLSFEPKKVTDKMHTLLEPFKFNNVTLEKEEKKTYRIQQTNLNQNFFLIEVAAEQVKKGESLLKVVVEKYKDVPQYKSEEGVVISDKLSYGKQVIIASLKEETEEDLLVTVYRDGTQGNTNCLIKYLSVDTSEPPTYEYKEDISVSMSDNIITVKYTEILKEKPSTEPSQYYIELFDSGEVEKNSIHSAYTGSNLAFYKKEVDASNDGASKTLNFTVDQKNIIEDVYLQMTLVFTKENGEQERLSYKEVKIEDVQHPAIEQKKYTHSSFKSEKERITKRLKNPNSDSVILVEIGKDVLLSSKSNLYNLLVDYKGYSLSPLQGNSTQTINAAEEVDKTTTYLTLTFKEGAPKNDIILEFYLESKSKTRLRALEESTFTEVGFTMKYKTGSKPFEPTKFNFDSSASASYFVGTLTVKFKEAISSPSEVNSSAYRITLYDKSKISKIPDIALEESDQAVVTKYDVKGGNKGDTIKHDFSPDKDVIVSITGIIETADGEEVKVAYNIVDPNSYTFILIIILVVVGLILIAIGGFLIIKCLGKRRLNSELLQLSNTGKKGESDNGQKTIALVGQVN